MVKIVNFSIIREKKSMSLTVWETTTRHFIKCECKMILASISIQVLVILASWHVWEKYVNILLATFENWEVYNNELNVLQL